jgi:hypothetical protein
LTKRDLSDNILGVGEKWLKTEKIYDTGRLPMPGSREAPGEKLF